MKLFGGLIGWRANKQDIITTLTIKAKLLALAQAAKESMYVNKLLQKFIIDFND
jgi:Zn-dependent M16 (insulinase) family peptidase